VWFEIYDDPATAITCEKEIKKWRRAWKIGLIEAVNPNWDDVRHDHAVSFAASDSLLEIPGSTLCAAPE